MRKTTISAALIASITIGLFSNAALAEDKKPKPQEKAQDYGYTFTDDALLGTDLQGQTGVIKVRPTGMRDRLIKPRTQFVAEMLKSIEHI
jgi:hypothetical protein